MATSNPDLTGLRAVVDAASKGPWFFNSYCGVFSAPLSQAWDALPTNLTKEEEYAADALVCEVPAQYGDTAPRGSKQHADAELLALAPTLARIALLVAEGRFEEAQAELADLDATLRPAEVEDPEKAGEVRHDGA